MLDPWIIEEILRREEDKRREQERRIELPLDAPRSTEQPSIPPKNEESERGVVIIDI